MGPLLLAALVTGSVAFWLDFLPAQIFDWCFALVMVATFWGLLPRAGVPQRLALPLSFGMVGALVVAQALYPDIRLAPYLAIFVVNLVMGSIFARGLLPGRAPILMQVIELMNLDRGRGAGFTPAFRRFVRGQCVLWAVLGLVSGLLGAAAMLLPGIRAALDPAIAALLLGQLAWFVLSHHYAAWRYGRSERWLMTMKVMCRPATWSVLKI